MKKIIKFNIWNFLDTDEVNEWLDDELIEAKIKGIAEDISYEVISIKHNGEVSIEADFNLEEE